MSVAVLSIVGSVLSYLVQPYYALAGWMHLYFYLTPSSSFSSLLQSNIALITRYHFLSPPPPPPPPPSSFLTLLGFLSYNYSSSSYHGHRRVPFFSFFFSFFRFFPTSLFFLSPPLPSPTGASSFIYLFLSFFHHIFVAIRSVHQVNGNGLMGCHSRMFCFLL